MRTIYRAGRVWALVFLIMGGSFIAPGGHAIAAGGVMKIPVHVFVITFLLGAAGIGAGVCNLLTRVTVDAWGLAKRAPFAGSFRASWGEVESWSVHRGSPGDEGYPQASFRLRGQRKSVVVHADDVSRPRFDAFLEEVRARVGDRETTEPDAVPDRAGG